MEREARHKKKPLLDELAIIADSLSALLEEKSELSDSEKRILSRIRRITRR